MQSLRPGIWRAGLPTQDKDGYYLIHNADELLWFRNTVNAGQNTIKGRLANDIDMTGACENWVPIGNHYNKYPFKGTFDGAGKTIRNFDVTSAGGSSGFGLFGVAGAKPGYGELAKYTVIKNFTIEGSITSTNTSYGAAVGGVVGDARGYVQVQDVTVDMTIKPPAAKWAASLAAVMKAMSSWTAATSAILRAAATA